MGVMIITILSGLLVLFKFITINWFMIIVGASIAWLFICSLLYLRFGFLKFYYHDLLGWHKPDESTEYHDGCSQCAKCKYCGKDIMQDSQGNWF